MKNKNSTFILRRAACRRLVVLLILLPLAVLFLYSCLPTESLAADDKIDNGAEPYYAAKVGDRIITIAEYNKAVARLHTTGRVGEVLSGVQDPSFEKPDYKGFLEELIEKELVIGEAEKLGLNKDEKFTAKVEIDRLNVFLSRLKEEYVTGKIEVSAKDIEKYYNEVDSKRLEEEYKKKKEKDPAFDETVKKFDELSEEYKKNLKSTVYIAKSKEAETEFFKKVRKNASVKINKKALKAFSVNDIGSWDTVIAKVDGLEITGRDLMAEMRTRRFGDDRKESVLDSLILYKAMDAMATSKNYGKDPEVAARLKKDYGDALITEFKNKVIVPLVKVSNDDMKKYYDKNKERFKEADMYYLKGILVGTEAEAKSVIKELKKGASFSFLADKLSQDKMSAKNGGDLGWVAGNTIADEVLKDLRKAKRGKIIGPYKAGPHMYLVYEFREMKAGKYTPFEDKDVKEHIYITIGRERFKENYDSYVKTLRSTVPVVINEAVFKRASDADKKQ